MNAPTNLKNLLPATNVQQGKELVHESAHLHVTGTATYIDDIAELAGTLYAAIIMSPVAHGVKWREISLQRLGTISLQSA